MKKKIITDAGNTLSRDGSEISGGNFSMLTGGICSKLKVGDHGTAVANDGSVVTGGEDSAVIGGIASKLSGGENSILQFVWFDGQRKRVTTAYVGENGILPNHFYTCENGKILRAH